MPKITIDLTARRKRIMEAMAEDRGITLDQLMEPYLRDLVNGAGMRGDLPDALQDAIADDVAAKAAAKKATRNASAPAT